MRTIVSLKDFALDAGFVGHAPFPCSASCQLCGAESPGKSGIGEKQVPAAFACRPLLEWRGIEGNVF